MDRWHGQDWIEAKVRDWRFAEWGSNHANATQTTGVAEG
jgi:hypothetical protein